jgi:poly-beta-1,6-N-acetyl-D-glucosamine synthase
MIWIITFGCYYVLLVWLTIGWQIASKKCQGTIPDGSFSEMVSIIIPLRNESLVLKSLFSFLSAQSYSANHYEIIFVDDHSDDGTFEKVKEYVEAFHLSSAHIIKSEGKGKKFALATGIRLAKGSIIITTDGDCCGGSNWLSSVIKPFHHSDIKMSCGLVKIEPDTSLFSTIQALEFSSLIGVGAATLALKLPTMCNGANLAFRKEAYIEVGGYQGNLDVPSGDDEFLLKKIASKYPDGVIFNTDSQALIITRPSLSVNQFVHQRVRWASKWKVHRGIFHWLLPVGVFVFYSIILTLPAGVLIGYLSLHTAIGLFFTKMILEYLFLNSVAKRLRQPWNWLPFFFWQVFYPFYAIFIGLLANFTSYKWKGRLHPVRSRASRVST